MLASRLIARPAVRVRSAFTKSTLPTIVPRWGRSYATEAEEKDLVIIGGGVAGYVAAIKAGQEGLKVRILVPESHGMRDPGRELAPAEFPSAFPCVPLLRPLGSTDQLYFLARSPVLRSAVLSAEHV